MTRMTRRVIIVIMRVNIHAQGKKVGGRLLMRSAETQVATYSHVCKIMQIHT